MKLNKYYRVIVLLLTSMLIIPTGAIAKSSVAGRINKVNTYGDVNITDSYVSAGTTASEQTMVKVRLTYNYGWGTMPNQVTYDSGYETSVSVQAKVDYPNAVSIIGYASHTVMYGSGVWRGSTSTED